MVVSRHVLLERAAREAPPLAVFGHATIMPPRKSAARPARPPALSRDARRGRGEESAVGERRAFYKLR
jgi:hypothetical protein